jgi:lipocalin
VILWWVILSDESIIHDERKRRGGYEIARLDHSFERNLSNVTVEYTLREGGEIDVLNKSYDDMGRLIYVEHDK